MLLSTFGASLDSTALRHCITIRWLSVGSASDGILLKTDFAFELQDIPDPESVTPAFPRSGRCKYASWGRGLNLPIFHLHFFFWEGNSVPEGSNKSITQHSPQICQCKYVWEANNSTLEKGVGELFFFLFVFSFFCAATSSSGSWHAHAW